MRLYEFESKQLLARSGIRVPRSQLITSASSFSLSEDLLPGIVKVQTLSGKRALRGGVQPVDDVGAVRDFAKRFLKQGFGDEPVDRILLEERIDFVAEYFLGITYDSRARKPLLLFSRQGGANIEETARSSPDLVKTQLLPPSGEVRSYEAIEWLSEWGFSGKLLLRLAGLVRKMARLFHRYDALLLEFNPLASTAAQDLVVLDCHLDIDDDALKRQSLDFEGLSSRMEGARQPTEFEQKAREIDQLDYRGVAGRMIEFDGNLGLLIGGGGASLTAFDAVRNSGGSPANYCEIGGNPTVRKVQELTKLLVSRPGVEKLAVIMNVVSNTRSDLVARGVIKGMVEAGRDPEQTIAVFRLPGAGEEECKKILKHYGVPFCGREVSIDEAAALAVERAGNETEHRA
jgi:succinyl-CoA synthetase beta subunit/citryl-CoA synthetase large subunit